jgi:hypothetical protein
MKLVAFVFAFVRSNEQREAVLAEYRLSDIRSESVLFCLNSDLIKKISIKTQFVKVLFLILFGNVTLFVENAA